MRRPKKYESGEAAQYITRRSALRKLQLSLNDFRRLCILKGVFPREPKKRRRAQKGSTEVKILYHVKDIRFLLHEPIVWRLRDYKIFAKKSGRDRAIKDFKNLKRRLALYPILRLDHIVKERYPTFIDAIKDLDDCLNLLFLFSTFPSLKLVPREQSLMCRRLSMEFLHYVIASKALRKVFISIKGYYFQADIKGQKVTWIMPHYYPFRPQHKTEVDFKVMSLFVEFYTVMLGFVNFRLYHSINLAYPPQFPTSSITAEESESSYISDRIATLNFELLRTDYNAEIEADADIDMELMLQDSDSKRIIKLKQEAQEIARLRTLFKGLKIFINREVPREPIVIILRSFGAKVSWDSTIFAGATFSENDESITHQIIDRPSVPKQYNSRDYVQPQWVFDCVNQRKLLPTNQYFMGVALPPHLSPFVDPTRDTYIPPEERALQDPSLVETHVPSDADSSDDDEQEETEAERDERLQLAYMEDNFMDDDDDRKMYDNVEDEEEDIMFDTSDDNDDDAAVPDFIGLEQSEEKKQLKLAEKEKMTVEQGKVYKENKRLKRKEEVDEHRLKARMVKPRHRRLYAKLINEKIEKEKENWLLRKKRKIIDENEKQEQKLIKKQAKRKAAANKD